MNARSHLWIEALKRRRAVIRVRLSRASVFDAIDGFAGALRNATESIAGKSLTPAPECNCPACRFKRGELPGARLVEVPLGGDLAETLREVLGEEAASRLKTPKH